MADEAEDKMDEEVCCDANNEDGMDATNDDDLPESSSTSAVAHGKGSSSKINGKSKKKKKKKRRKNKNMPKEDNKTAVNGDAGSEPKDSEVYLPGDPMEEGEELTFDSSAYKMYHVAQTGAPCLSFDILSDELGENRTEFPMTVYIVAGTQSEHRKQNHLIIMKMSDLQEMEDEDSDDDEIIDEVPDLSMQKINHDGAINRVRHCQTPGHQLVATWSETGKVHIWDVSQQIISLDNESTSTKKSSGDNKPLYSFNGHQTEGFAMDWSKTVPGRLVTGDCNKNIHLWNPTDDGSWHVDQRPYSSHTQSVEDLQWSPNEATVFASCSVDHTIKIWDTRVAHSKACMLTTTAHDTDVNVISWNRNEPLLLSGGDDGIIKVWDLRQFQKGEPVAVFKHHTAAITSVEWLPTDNSAFAASGSDNQITLWDLAVEKDEGEEETGKPVDVPPQLLFIHMGQKDIKELHWHRQIPGVVISTAENGLNIFKTISV